nr:PREDICTED: merozoite surface antigen 2 isoform X3 [Tribolium castaneum]|eukprot:XP_008192327.1 PREDICTED: merozoite surface antigen 2 isoform X3 [Tribolium castaneum]
MWLLLHATLFLPVLINALPTNVAKSSSVSASFESSAAAPLLSFDNGNVGVNFLGYHASAGLGGLLTGNAADGGLHAEAGTPFGQQAGAGLGGTVDASGRAAGGLYAGATSGAGASAGAGLGGATGASGSVGGSFAGASSGGVETHITKISHKAPAVATGKLTVKTSAPVVHKEVEVVATPVIQKEVEVVAEQPKPQTTYIERTVIPNYVEKKIQVPSYVEKTIRVPTTVEKTIRVPAQPTVIEKEVSAPASVGVRGSYAAEVETVPKTVTYVQKTKVHGHHHPHVHQRVHYKNVSQSLP